MSFHLGQQTEVLGRVEEHASHNFGQDAFGGAGDACVIQQMASLVFSRGKEIVGEPTNQRALIHAVSGLQELHATKHTAVLVLPTSTGGEQLFEDKGAVANLVLVPFEAAEIGHGTEDGGSQDGAGTQSGACRDG